MGRSAAAMLIAASFFGGWWTVDNINWKLFYPEVTHSGPALRHVYTDGGKVRWIQKFNEDKQVWEWSHIDWTQPDPLPMDPSLLTLGHVPDDGQEGTGQGAGGLDPTKWHGGDNE